MKKRLFGKLENGTPVHTYRLENGEIYAEILDFGAAIHKFGFLDEKETNLVGSFDTIEDYLADGSHQGATIGRVANRIKNAELTLDGKVYHLTKNDGENCHHGGNGFDRKVWDVLEYSDTSILFSYYSHDGEEGFPGGVKVSTRYTLVGTALVIEYKAIPEKKTPISLTNHAYFNLDGMGGDVLMHKIQIFADRYSAADERHIPNGEHPTVEGTRFDLRSPKTIGDGISGDFKGYDQNFLLCPTVFEDFLGEKLGLDAVATNKNIALSVYSNMNDMQFYTGNFLKGKPDFAGGIKKIIHGAFCLEAQVEPNAVNHGVSIYDAGEVYSRSIVYKLEKIKKD